MKIKFGFFLSLLAVLIFPQYINSQVSDGQAADSVVIEEPKAIHVVDINFEIERTHKRLSKMERELEPKSEFILLDSMIIEHQAFVEKEAIEFKQYNPYNLSKYFLENTFRAWSGHKEKLEEWMEQVNGQLVNTQENVLALNFDKQEWNLTLERVQSMDEPAQLVERIGEVVEEIEVLDRQFAKQRREMILREDEISDIVMVTDEILDEVSLLQQRYRDNLFVASEPTLWKTPLSSSDLFPILPRLKKAWHENAKTVRNFTKEINFISPLLFAVVIALLFFLIKRAYRKIGLSDMDPNFVFVKRILFDHPYAAIISFVITIIILYYSTIPLILIGFLGIILLICMMIFLPGVIGKRGKVIVLVVLILNIVNLSEIVAWYFGNFARYSILAEALLALYLTYKYGLQGFKKPSKNTTTFGKGVWLLSVLLFTLFTVALLSNVFGYMNLAVLMLKVGAKVAAIVVVIFGAHAILRAVVLACIAIGRKTQSKVMENRWDAFEKRTLQLVNILAIVILVKYVLQNMEVFRPVMDWLVGFLTNNWEIGTMQISIGGIFSLVLILAVSFGLANFFKVFVEDEFLIRTNLPKGVPAAISVTVRYFIIVLGLTMAISAAGIDLGSFGLLAGALGVGIGFGLQNIVNNFISGLILVYERPVNVGDTVEVETLLGIVNRIGVRSSNVRTFDGAEVVVPNGNLISNQLVNWTLSDNQRRVELKIGAAYGSDPNIVLELLKKVAMDNEDVLKEPEPLALFEEFGDSSLNFRLLFWVPFQKGLGVKSNIAIGVYNIFAENGVEIPFPQIDLHVKEEKKEPLIVAKTSTTESSDDTPIDKPLLNDSIEKNEET